MTQIGQTLKMEKRGQTHKTKFMKNVLIAFLTLVTASAAANGIDGEVLVKVGTTGNKSIPSSQTTNITISAISKVTNSANAVAFSYNSSNVLSTSGAKLATFGNGGSSVYIFGAAGYMEINGAEAEIVGVNGTSKFDALAESTDAFFQLSTASGSQNILIYNDATEQSIGIRNNATPITLLSPRIADGSTPYTFDTSLAHTSGNLLEVKNMGTNCLVLDANGSIDVGPGQALSLVGRSDFKELYGHLGGNNFNAYVDSSDVYFSLGVSGDRLILHPTASDGTTPYTFNTPITHTTGNLAEFKNNGTNYVNFEADQASTNTPITININGTLQRVHVGAPDSGGTGLRALTILN